MINICGIAQFSGEPVHQAQLYEFLKAQGGDSNFKEAWTNGVVGFGCRTGRLESFHEQSPYFDSAQNLAIVSTARIDNRHELLEQFHITNSDASRFSDTRLILLAYSKWGVECPVHLYGDFSFVIWDHSNSRLFCARGLGRSHPFCYRWDESRFAFSSDGAALLALPGVVKRLNPRPLALLAAPLQTQLAEPADSYFDGVKSLPLGACLVADVRGPRVRQYWSPQPRNRLPYRDPQDIFDAFKALWNRTIADRLRTTYPVASMLSGGLDSSAIVATAARLLADRGQRLTVICCVPNGPVPNGIVDEREYMEQLTGLPNVDPLWVTPKPESGPFDDIDGITARYESPFVPNNHYVDAAVDAAASATGARILFTGQAGELGPTYHAHAYFTELFLRFRWYRLWQQVVDVARVRGTTPRAIVLRRLYPRLVQPTNARAVPMTPQKPLDYSAVLNQEFLRRQLGPAREWVCKLRPNPLRVGTDHRTVQAANIRAYLNNHAYRYETASYPSVELVKPYTDRRILEFCLAAPGEVKVRDGYHRYLIRGGLNGQLPPKIQWRRSKSPYSPDYAARYDAQRPKVTAYLAAIGRDDPVRAIVDVEALRTLHSTTPGTARFARAEIPFGVYTIAFLRQFPEFRR